MPTSVEILGEDYWISTLSRKSLRELLDACPLETDFEEALCEVCVIEWPHSFPRSPEGGLDFDNCAAGIPSRLAAEIMDASGYVNPEATRKLALSAQQWALSIEGRYDILALYTQPGLTLEQLDNALPEDLHKIYAAARVISEVIMGLSEEIPIFLGETKKSEKTLVENLKSRTQRKGPTKTR